MYRVNIVKIRNIMKKAQLIINDKEYSITFENLPQLDVFVEEDAFGNKTMTHNKWKPFVFNCEEDINVSSDFCQLKEYEAKIQFTFEKPMISNGQMVFKNTIMVPLV